AHAVPPAQDVGGSGSCRSQSLCRSHPPFNKKCELPALRAVRKRSSTAPKTDLHTADERLLETLLHQAEAAVHTTVVRQISLFPTTQVEHSGNQIGSFLDEHSHRIIIEIDSVLLRVSPALYAVAQTLSSI